MEKYLFSFDRDLTVSISNGPVPLEWVKHLNENTDHIVWAHGNQALCNEADIPGFKDLNVNPREYNFDVDHVRASLRHKRVLAIGEHVGDDVVRRIVIDDINLEDLEDQGWEYYTPEDFVDAFEDKIYEL